MTCNFYQDPIHNSLPCFPPAPDGGHISRNGRSHTYRFYKLELINTPIRLPSGSAVKNLPANAGDVSSIPGLGRSPREGPDYPLKYSYLEEYQGQRSLAGSSLWGCKRVQLDLMTQFSRLVVPDSLQPHESQHARPPCPTPTSGVYSNPRPLSQ